MQWKRVKASLVRYCSALSQALQSQWGIRHGRHPNTQLFTTSGVSFNVFVFEGNSSNVKPEDTLHSSDYPSLLLFDMCFNTADPKCSEFTNHTPVSDLELEARNFKEKKPQSNKKLVYFIIFYELLFWMCHCHTPHDSFVKLKS